MMINILTNPLSLMQFPTEKYFATKTDLSGYVTAL